MNKLVCYYCAHNKEQMLKMPLSQYNEKTNTYKFYGNFCSWECMKSYNLYSKSSYKSEIFNFIQKFHDRNSTK